MQPSSYEAAELFALLESQDPSLFLLDVRSEEDHQRSKVEYPGLRQQNLSYIDFIEEEQASIQALQAQPTDRIRLVCAKEGSSQYVAELLLEAGFEDVAYLAGGITSWGDLLVPKLIAREETFRLYQFQRPGKASLSYGLIRGAEMMLFDPSRNEEFYLAFAKSQGARIIAIAETHLQADYLSGAVGLQRVTGAKIYGHPKDFHKAEYEVVPLKDGLKLRFSDFGGVSVQALHTPGHTPGSTSFLVADRYLISGDSLFIRSIGRPDLGGMWQAWAKTLFVTLQERILKWDRSWRLLPGHYQDWSEADEEGIFQAELGKVIKSEPELFQIRKESDFLAYIEERMRPQPAEYGEIRNINLHLHKPIEDQQKELDLGKNQCSASAA